MPTSRAKDLADFIAKQSTDDDAILETGALQLPDGTTAQRPTAVNGMIRYNSTISLAEYYDGNGWKSIDSPPTVSSISPTNIADTDSDVDITITGDFFASGATVKAIGTDLSEIAAASVTFNSATELVANFDGTDFDDANEDYDIEVTNPSGLAGKGNDLLSVNASPAFTTAAGSLGIIYDAQRADNYSLSTAAATDDENDSLTYSVSVGSLPAGLSLNTSTAAITGTATAVGSDTTTTFTISVTDGVNTNTRQFSITVKAPVVTSYTSVGSGSFSVPSGVTHADVLVVAGGGGGGRPYAGGGGAGGLIYRPAFPVTPSGSVSYTVGGGGSSPAGDGQSSRGNDGQDSVFGALTAKGGGGGGYFANITGNPGGSGGGGGGNDGPGAAAPTYAGGTGIQPQQPGDSGTYGFGNAGGPGSVDGNGAAADGSWVGGGGGGAGATGNTASNPQHTDSAAGGIGKQYGISGSQVYYAGGGGGGAGSSGSAVTYPMNSGGQGGGGGGSKNATNATASTTNRGGGGGGGGGIGNGATGGGNGTGGASGIVIVSY